MSPAYAVNLGLRILETKIKAQKIDGSILGTYRMVIARFFLQDKWGQDQFFKKIFILADVSVKMIIGILFLFFSNANLQFSKVERLIWRNYTTTKALSTTKKVELIEQREFCGGSPEQQEYQNLHGPCYCFIRDVFLSKQKNSN